MAERKTLPDDAAPEIVYTVRTTHSGQNVQAKHYKTQWVTFSVFSFEGMKASNIIYIKLIIPKKKFKKVL